MSWPFSPRMKTLAKLPSKSKCVILAATLLRAEPAVPERSFSGRMNSTAASPVFRPLSLRARNEPASVAISASAPSALPIFPGNRLFSPTKVATKGVAGRS